MKKEVGNMSSDTCFVQCWVSEQEARQTQPQRRKINSRLVFLESGQALQLSSLWNLNQSVVSLSRKPGPTDCMLDRDLSRRPEFSIPLQLSLQVPRAVRDSPAVTVVWAVSVMMVV